MAIVRKDIRDPVSVGRTEWRPVGIKLRIGGTLDAGRREARNSLVIRGQTDWNALLLEAESPSCWKTEMQSSCVLGAKTRRGQRWR